MKKSLKVGLTLSAIAGAAALVATQKNKNAAPEPFVTFTDDTKLYTSMETTAAVTTVLPVATVVSVLSKKHISKNLWLEVQTPYGHGFILDETVLPQMAGAVHIELDVPYVNQYEPVNAPFGCEGAALLMGLKFKGYTEDTLDAVLDNMPTADRNPNEGFVGSPYEASPESYYQTIYPAPLAAYAQERYSKHIADISGSNIQDVRAELEKGNPVVLYVTKDFEAPVISEWDFGTPGTEEAVDNLHIVLLVGYDSTIGEYKVADPSSERHTYWTNGYALEKAYNAQQHAVVIR